MGLHKAVALCMDHCYTSGTVGDDSWYKTAILAGGSSCLPGLPGIFPMHIRADILFRYYLVSKRKWDNNG